MNKSPAIILEHTSHPGNIGAVARAMKTMGLDDLRLVQPKQFPHSDAYARASGADDILFHAQIFDTVEQAVADCQIVIGASARRRSEYSPTVIMSTALHQWLAEQPAHRVGLLFGNEQNGLDNLTLALCHAQVVIPTNPDFSSLNIAAAVQILAYEYSHHRQATPSTQSNDLATHGAITALIDQTMTRLQKTRFINPENPQKTRAHMLQICHRAALSHDEVNLLHGVLKQILKPS